MAQSGELKAREELDKLREEIKSERAHVRSARDIEKCKQESSIKKQWDEFHKQTDNVNQHLTNLLTTFSELPIVNVSVAGKSFRKICYNYDCHYNLNFNFFVCDYQYGKLHL